MAIDAIAMGGSQEVQWLKIAKNLPQQEDLGWPRKEIPREELMDLLGWKGELYPKMGSRTPVFPKTRSGITPPG